MSFPRTVSWPVFQPGWSRALTELTTMSLGITFVYLGRHGGYLAIGICIRHANVQPVSLTAVSLDSLLCWSPLQYRTWSHNL